MIARSAALVVTAGLLLAGLAGPRAETVMYVDRALWVAGANVTGSENYDSYSWNQPGGELLTLGGSYGLGRLSYQMSSNSALHGIGPAVDYDAPYLAGNYLEWQSLTAGEAALTINLPLPVSSFGIDFGQFYGASLPFMATLGNGDTFNLSTAQGSNRFVGFVSDRLFSSVTLVAPAFPLIDNLQWGHGRLAAVGTGRLAFASDGIGHMLVIPYFSAQRGNATLVNVVNVDQERGKAVKVRFRGASNADAILDFQLFLAPGDAWAANVSEGPDGVSRLFTADRSCTLPPDVNVDFSTARLNTNLIGEELANETREGYVEIINMGDIAPDARDSSLWAATRHDEAGRAPCTAAVLGSLTVSDSRLLAPTTGLMANWVIINVPNTTIWSGEAEAIEARAQGVAALGRNVYWPQNATTLTAGQIEANTADPLFRAGAVAAASHDLPDLSTPYLPDAGAPIGQATELSDALAARVVAVEYLSDPTISASTDWVFSQPTRRYYAAVDYAVTDPATSMITNYDQFGLELSEYYRSKYVGDGNLLMGNPVNEGKPWQACAQLTADRFWNRESVSPRLESPIATPQPLPPMWLCGAVSVVGINSPISPVGADVSRINWTRPRQVDASWGYVVYPNVPLVDGWGVIAAHNSFEGVSLGLPMQVRHFVKAVNPAVSAGVSGTFGATGKGRVLQQGVFFAP